MKMRISAGGLALLVMVLPVIAADWPNFRGPDHNGNSLETGSSATWPAEGLVCFDFANGEVKWSDKASDKGSRILADGKLIVLGEKGELLVAEASPKEFNPISRAQVL